MAVIGAYYDRIAAGLVSAKEGSLALGGKARSAKGAE
jgi:hypothetical protein